MKFPRLIILLFALNFIDAILTIYWVRNGFATEGNALMASLMDIGDMPFLIVKIAIGAVTAMVLYHWKNLPIAKVGLTLALIVYVGLMGVHFVTGLSALGFISQAHIHVFDTWTHGIFAFII